MYHRLIASSVLIAALHAGDAAPAVEPPLVSLGVADGAVLSAHWDASVYGRVWQDPGLAWVREQWAAKKGEVKTSVGLDIDAILAAAKGLRGEYLGLAGQMSPQLRCQVDLGVHAVVVFELISRRPGVEPVQVAGADEACRLSKSGPVLARHRSNLVLAMGVDAVPFPVTPIRADVAADLDYDRLIADVVSAMPPMMRGEMEKSLGPAGQMIGRMTWDSTLVPQGIHESVRYAIAEDGMRPVDRAVLDRFPATTMAVLAVGLDGPAMWKLAGPMWLETIDQAMHGGTKAGTDQTRAEVDAMLAGLGVAGGLQQLVDEAKGTVVVAVTPGVPFPAVSLVAPRSPAIDALIAAGVRALGAEPPATGAAAILPIPDLPIMVQLACDKGHWLLSSDAVLVPAWLEGKPAGFLGSASAKAMLATAPADASCLGALDTAAALRTVTPFAAMGLMQARGMPEQAKRAIQAGLNRLALESGPSWLWSGRQGDAIRLEAEGPLGLGVAPLAIIAAIAIPNLLESRVTANEAAAGASLKSGVFPAQIQFQAGGYMDQDGDNIGEYGTLAELSGRQPTNKVQADAIKLLQGPLGRGNIAVGYHFRIDLPDAAGAAASSDDAPRVADAAVADAQEKFWIAYAWPESTDTGRTMFALAHDGQLRSMPWDGQVPAWNAALGGGWEAAPTWPVHGHGARRAVPAAGPAAGQPAANPLF